jgi:hypothetical protein
MRRLAIILLVSACDTRDVPLPPEPSFIEVAGSMLTDVELDTGSNVQAIEEVLAFSKETRTLRITGTTLDRNSDPYPYTGPVAVTMQPGKIKRVQGGRTLIDSGDTEKGGVTLWYGDAVDGKIDLEVSIANGFGPTRVWVTATKEENTPGGSYATGVTEVIDIALPTIAQVQREDSHEGNEMEKEHVVFRTDDREVVVTGLTTNGFWVTDLANVADFGSLFVYSFSKPEGVAVGERITMLSGGVSEHIGVTQLAWPSYESDPAQQLAVPAATVLDGTNACSETAVSSDWALAGTNKTNDLGLEALEGSLVRLEKAKIWSGFDMPEDPADLERYSPEETFYNYGQWPVEIEGGCVVFVLTQTTVPDFDPPTRTGEEIGPITGFLSYAQSSNAWILLVRGPDDFPKAGPANDAPEGPSSGREHRRITPSPHHFTPRARSTQLDEQCALTGSHSH